MTPYEARQKIETLAAEMCEAIQRDRGFKPDGYWIDRKSYRIQDLKGNPIATLHVEPLQ